ncbi:MAG TPA: DinB family protein [Planctomycetota bacterium]|nr:DinB family protein [Planctomycetota bacterium]
MNERQALAAQLQGAPSHTPLLQALEGLPLALAGHRVAGAGHTIYQILHHMDYWRRISLGRLSGHPPPRPHSAALGWTAPEAPAHDADWQAAVAQLAEGLRALEAFVLDPRFDLDTVVQPDRGTSARAELLMIMGHDSHHLGQIVLLRQLLGAWPPPRGGDTW